MEFVRHILINEPLPGNCPGNVGEGREYLIRIEDLAVRSPRLHHIPNPTEIRTFCQCAALQLDEFGRHSSSRSASISGRSDGRRHRHGRRLSSKLATARSSYARREIASGASASGGEAEFFALLLGNRNRINESRRRV